MATTLGIGFAGCGRATETLHLPALARVPGLRAVAAADPEPARRAAVRRAAPGLRLHADVQGLLGDPEVDVVAVCVPPALHAPVAIAALDAGRHVYLEKPVAVTWEDALAIQAAAAGSAGAVAMGLNLRSHRLVREAAGLLATGAVGPVEMVRTAWTSGFHRGPDWPAWRGDRRAGGGALYEIAVHHLDLCRYLLGAEYESVAAWGRSGEHVDQSVMLTARMAGGVLVSIAAGQRTADANDVEVYGRDGVLRLSLYRADSLELHRSADLAGGPRARLRRGAEAARGLPAALAAARRGGDFRASYAVHWARVAGALRAGAPCPATLEDGLRAQAALLAAAESLETGEPVAVPARSRVA